MKINFISYLHPYYFWGGGEQYTRGIVSEGEKRKHIISFSSMAPRLFNYDTEADLDIVFDFWNCPGHPQFDSRILQIILRRGKYITGQCGYSNACFLSSLPCNGNRGIDERCVISRDDYFNVRGLPGPWFDGNCTIPFAYPLFKNALLNCFLSPLHRDTYIQLYGEETIGRTFLIKPILDINFFVNKGIHRDIEYASCGAMGEPKGYFNVRQMFPDGNIVLFGSHDPQLAGKDKFGKVVGKIPYEEMPHFLNRVKNYVHLPRWPEPNGLVVHQAALCGCNLILNERVGAASWKSLDLKNPSTYERPSEELWEYIEAL